MSYHQPTELISVVIPACNEARFLPATLAGLAENQAPHEVVLADGGSTDGTLETARRLGARLVRVGRPQRAALMNAGAMMARGEVLLFLPVNTRLAPAALQTMVLTLQDARVAGGVFSTHGRGRSWVTGIFGRLAEWRDHLVGGHQGNEVLFIRRQVFERLGGYRELELFTDRDLWRRMNGAGRVVTLRSAVLPVARTPARPVSWRAAMADAWLAGRYAFGADPVRLAAEARELVPARPSAAS